MREGWQSLSIVLMVFVFTLIYCGGGGKNGVVNTDNSIRLSVHVPSKISTTKPSIEPIFGDIRAITIIVEGSDFSTIQDTFNFPGEIKIFVPVGGDRTFRLLAFDASGALIFRGTAQGVTISPGQNIVNIDLVPVVEICSNGIDDDEDGRVDCADPDCEGQVCNLNGVTGTCENHECVLPSSPSPNAVDLSIIKSDAPDPIGIGDTLTYTLKVTNNSSVGATGVIVTDTLPLGVEFISSSASQGTCTGTATVVCNVGSIAGGGVVTIEIAVRVMTEGTIGNAADVIGNEMDPNLVNNTATSVTNAGMADLSVTKRGLPNPVTQGNNLTYTIVVTNNGASGATGVMLTDILPQGVTFSSATASQGTCGVPVGSDITCNLGAIAKGSAATVTIVVVAVKAGRITNTAVAMGNESDPTTANNTATEDTTVNPASTPSADLSVVKVGSLDTSDDVVYTVTVTNNGPSAATGVIFTDTLPSEIVEVDSVSPGPPTCNESGRTLTCKLGTIAKGTTTTVTIVVDVTAGTITNTAKVMGNEPDSNLSNNTATNSLDIGGNGL